MKCRFAPISLRVLASRESKESLCWIEVIVALSLLALLTSSIAAQTSSIGAKERERRAESPDPVPAREAPLRPRNGVYEIHSWITSSPPEPKTFRPGDLLTIIVRERKQWKADADLETKNKWDVKSELQDFTKFTDGGVGASPFRRGNPNINYKYETKLRNEGDSSRDDSLTTRLTARIIDVKPNGQLVIEGRASITHDDEVTEITITGVCRKEDVTADNTVLSTQIADKDVVVENEGALRSSASRGWVTKLLDLLKPF
jgi:flagellar L-ring protein FlgH